jgi:hypothetical protein
LAGVAVIGSSSRFCSFCKGVANGWQSGKTLVSVTAYHSFGGEVEPPYPFMPSFIHSYPATVVGTVEHAS